jgi:hypothetical protein
MTRPLSNKDFVSGSYKHGFVTEIESETAPKGLSEETVRFISAKKGEPEWLLTWRLKAFARGKKWKSRTGLRSIIRRLIIKTLTTMPRRKKRRDRKAWTRLIRTFENIRKTGHSA